MKANCQKQMGTFVPFCINQNQTQHEHKRKKPTYSKNLPLDYG